MKKSQFRLPAMMVQQFVGPSISVRNADSDDDAEPNFPDGMNYSTFLAMYHPDRANYTALSQNATTNSQLLSYFPDFCGDW